MSSWGELKAELTRLEAKFKEIARVETEITSPGIENAEASLKRAIEILRAINEGGA